MSGRNFAASGQFFHDALAISGKRKCLPHANVIQPFARHIKPIKEQAEITEGVKIRPFHENIQQLDRHQVLVPNNVRHAGFVKIQSCIWRAYRQDVDEFVPGIRCVPISGVLSHANFVV